MLRDRGHDSLIGLLVALTGFGQKHDKEQAKRAGFDAHLTKPADGAALAAILASRAERS
jgi:CheY-like chemotaxis protein